MAGVALLARMLLGRRLERGLDEGGGGRVRDISLLKAAQPAAPRPPDAISPSKPPCHLPPGNPGVKVLSLESPFKIQDPRPASQPQHSTVCQALSLQAGCWSPGRDQGSLDGCSGERVLPRGREAGPHRSRNAAEQPLPLLSWALAGPA